MAIVKVGDVVRYFPSADHACDKDVEGAYPWTFGFRQQRQVQQVPGGRWGWEDYVEVLDDRRMKQIENYLDKHANPDAERKKLLLIKPTRTWKAKVTAVNADGTVNLDIEARWCERFQRGNGFTLHYGPVPLVDHEKVKAVMAMPHAANGAHPAASLANSCYKEPTT